MSFSLTTFNESVDRLVQDSLLILSSDSVDALIKLALQQYSKDFPDVAVKEISGDGGKYYAVSSLTGWVEGFSKIQDVEYPAATVADDETPQLLDSEYWTLFEDATAEYLYFPSHSPSTSEKIRVWYTMPYTFSGTPAAVDVPVEDFYAICLLAASYCCDVLSTYYATHVDVGDGRLDVKRDKVSAKYEERARKYEAGYRRHMNLPLDGKPKAATVFGEWDVRPDGEYIYHPSWTR